MRAKFMRPGEHGDVIRRQHEQLGVSGALNLVAEMDRAARALWRTVFTRSGHLSVPVGQSHRKVFMTRHARIGLRPLLERIDVAATQESAQRSAPKRTGYTRMLMLMRHDEISTNGRKAAGAPAPAAIWGSLGPAEAGREPRHR